MTKNKEENMNTVFMVEKTNNGVMLKSMTNPSEQHFVPCTPPKQDFPIAIYNGKEFLATTALLHTHTGYSLLDGAIKPKNLAKLLSTGKKTVVQHEDITVVFCEYPQVVAITDHGNVFGGFQFSQELEAAGLKPIIGEEFYHTRISPSKEGNKNTEDGEGMDSRHMVLLCMSEEGYHNLCKLTASAEENFYRHPHVTWENLRKYNKGLICLSACLAGEIPQRLLNGDIDGAYEVAENFVDIFGDRFYIELQNHHIPDEDKVRPQLIKLARDLGIKMVATTDSHYLRPEDKKAHEVLLCVQTGRTMSDPNHFKFEGDGYHIPTNEEFMQNFDFIEEAIANQAEIVHRCSFTFKKKEITMPRFETGAKSTHDAFVEACWEGFAKRFPAPTEEQKARLEYEISIIAQMKFQAYFLIVADFIGYARSKGIAVGPGRGSAVGSLVAYVLGITNLNPMPYGLLFERFLNPERISMPDIDVDFQDSRRHEVLEYVRAKYGDECVSRIITFGTLAARAVIRDVARAMEIPLTVADKVAKAIPAEPKMTIEKALGKSAELRAMMEDPQIKGLIEIAQQLEGLPRHKSQHACGVIIAAAPVSDFVPEVILEDSDGNPARTAAYTGPELEDLGLLKFDFLGLRNMGIIKNAATRCGVDEDSIPLDDPYVYAKILSPGNTDGIFQVESGGMKSLMRDMFSDVSRRLKKLETQYSFNSMATAPDEAKEHLAELGRECFERLIAAISLYRPGPMDYIPQYVAGMKNPSSIHYDCKELEPILASTYGVLVYQEQVQQACRTLAGYSLGRADLIRRANSSPFIMET